MQATGRQAVLFLATVLGAAIPGAAAAQSPAACSLLAKAEVESLVGRTLFDGGDETTLAGGGSSCTYDGGEAQIVVFGGPSATANFDALLKSFGNDTDTKHPVPAAGAGAYVVYPTPRNKYQDRVALLVVRHGSHTLGVSVAAPDGATAESMLPAAIKLAEAVKGKLR